jgi:hypothetical protein
LVFVPEGEIQFHRMTNDYMTNLIKSINRQ